LNLPYIIHQIRVIIKVFGCFPQLRITWNGTTICCFHNGCEVYYYWHIPWGFWFGPVIDPIIVAKVYLRGIYLKSTILGIVLHRIREEFIRCTEQSFDIAFKATRECTRFAVVSLPESKSVKEPKDLGLRMDGP